MWQRQCDVAVAAPCVTVGCEKSQCSPVFVILSQFGLIFFKLNKFHPYIKFNFYINFTMIFLL